MQKAVFGNASRKFCILEVFDTVVEIQPRYDNFLILFVISICLLVQTEIHIDLGPHTHVWVAITTSTPFTTVFAS